MFFAKQHHKKGFTLAETILVVAIIAILLAVAAPNVLAYYRQLKLTGLDDDAKTIFMAAQSRLTAMLSAGEELKEDSSGSPLPHQGTGTCKDDVAGDVGFKFVTFEHSDIKNLLPGGSIESQLQDNCFIVEYNEKTGAVHAVWYWEKDSGVDIKSFTTDSKLSGATGYPDYNTKQTTKDYRLDKGAMIGYYGGRGIERPELGQMPIPELNIINAEELRLDIKVSKEQIEKALSSGTALDYNVGLFTVDIYVNDADSKMMRIVKDAPLKDNATIDVTSLTGSVVLGTLHTKPDRYKGTTLGGRYYIDGKKFKDWEDLDDGNKSIIYTGATGENPEGIHAGNDITVTVVLKCKEAVTLADGSTRQLISQSASAQTNSLFASVKDDGTDKVAEIAYGRHLQNLDNDEFGITKAVQTRTIDFMATAGVGEDTIYYWNSIYGHDTVKFSPINTFEIDGPYDKHKLTEYDGGNFEIRNLNIKNPYTNPTQRDGASLGLFGSLYDVTGDPVKLENIFLVNTKNDPDSPGSKVGALVGELTLGELTNCHVYLDEIVDGKLTDKNPRLQASANVGGLVGSVMSPPYGSYTDFGVTISNCSAATVISGSNNAGGLVGVMATGDCTIVNSYAACNITGAQVGGLVGMSGNIDIKNSYAAGTAGVIGGGVATSVSGLFNYSNAVGGVLPVVAVENSYAAVLYGTSVTTSPYGAYRGAVTGGSAYYVKQDGVTYETGSGNEVSMSTLTGMIGDTTFTGANGWYVPDGGSKVNPSNLTYPYNTLDTALTDPYPYPMLQKKLTDDGGNLIVDIVDEHGNPIVVGSGVTFPMAHYGDWVEGANGEATAAYIEKYDDDTYGVYAAKKDADGNITAISTGAPLQNKVVVDDFYAIISPSDPGEFTLDGDTANLHKLNEVAGIDDELQKAIGAGMKLYTPESILDWDSVTNYYHKIKFEASGKTYLYNTSFACEAFDVTEYVADTTHNVSLTDRLEKPGMDKFVPDPDKGTKHNDTDVYIRSARQLANIQVYTQNTNTDINKSQGWTYEQLAKIDFKAYNKTGFTTGKTDNDATRLTPALLKTGSYYGHQYTISNLYIGTATEGAGLFERVGSSTNHDATVNGVQLVNVDVKGEAATATGGLVGMLYGIVDECGIYVSEATEYPKWIIKGKGANGVGGLIGEINGGTAKTSFASVNVKGEAPATGDPAGPVGGFAGQITGKGTVDNCYAGGFVDEDTKTYSEKNANVTGEGSVGGFVGAAADGSIFTGVNYSTASVKGTDHEKLGLFAGNMKKPTATTTASENRLLNAVAKAFVGTDEVAPRDESDYIGLMVGNPDPKTVGTKEVYNQDPSVEFPFPSGQEVHHGDWIEVKAMGVYYDTVNGVTGYYANGKKIDGQTELVAGTPGDGQVASDDGYMFVTEKDLGPTLSIKVGGKDFTMTQTNLTSPWTINGKTYNYSYEVPAEALNTPTDNYYTAVSINGRIFHANFGAACEIFDTVNNVNEPMAKDDIAGLGTTNPYKGVVVRSARQLANIGIRSNVGTYTGNVKNYTEAAKAIQKAAISQVLDIDYSKYTTTKIPKAAVLDGSNTNANHTPITINGGSYDGHSYEIRNLVPGMIRQVSGVSGGNVTEALIESGLVGRITEGEIKNVTLINATVVNNAGKVTENGTGGSNVAHTLKGSDLSSGQHTGSLSYTSKGMIFNVYFNFNGTTSGSNDKVENGSQKTWSDGKKYSQYIRFGGAGSSDGTDTKRAVEFTTSYPATIKVWWVRSDANENRQLGIYRERINDSNLVKESSGKTQTPEILECETTEPGKYYITSTNARTDIYAIEVTEHVPATILGSLDPDGSTFPDALSTAYKARFGALVGAVNPATKADDEVVISNCGVYVEPENLPAGAVKDWTLADKQAVETKYNDDYKKYAVENSATSINDDAIGGLIGMATQGTTIKDSFATVKVTGVKSVGGFAGVLKNVTVEDCYSGGHTENGIYSSTDYNVTANGSDSFAGGFVGQMQVESSGNLIFKGVDYSTASAKGSTVGAFSGRTTLTGVTTWDGYDGVKELYAIGLVAGDKQNDETYLDDTMTIRPYTSNGSATPYDVVLLEDIYPYMTVDDGTGEHHGDWTLRFNFVYYELYKEQGSDVTIGSNTSSNRVFSIGNKLDPDAQYIGFYASYAAEDNNGGITTKVINTLQVDKPVYDSGYMIVGNANVDKFPITILSRYLSSKEINWVEKHMRDPDKAEDPGKDATGEPYTRDNPPPKYINVDAEQIFDFEGLGNDVAQEIADEIGQYGYAIPLQGQDVAASNEFYLEVFVNGQLYLYNPQFPCEVVNSGMAVEDPKNSGKWHVDTKTIRPKEGINYIKKDKNGKDEELVLDAKVDGILIRNPWNLAGMARYSRPASTGQVSRDIVKQKFYQIMDVDYKEYNQNKISDANSSNRFFDGKDRINKAGTSWVFGQVPAVLTGGTYEGYNHTISNLYLSNDSSNNNSSGLFGTVTDGKIQDLRLDSIHVNTGSLAESGWKTDIGALAAVVKGNSTISNVHLSNIEIFLHKVPKVEKGDTSPNLKYSEPSNANVNKSVAEVNSVGGAIGSLQGGTVENVTVDGISIDLTHGVKYTIEDGGKKLVISPTTGTEYGSSMDSDSTPSVGGAIGEINCSASGASVSVSDLTVTDPTIKANRGANDKVGGVIGSADGTYSTYSADATEGTRPVKITNSGAYMSEDKKSNFDSMGVEASGSKLSGDYSGGFAGYLGKGVNVTRDYAAIRVQGKTYAGGFAGQIEGSHVESCYSGGYVEPTGTNAGKYSTDKYNVEAKTAGGFAGKIDLAKGGSGMALYMKGHNYTTSSANGTTKVGVFAGDFDDADLEALNTKMGGDAPVLYASGTVKGSRTNKLTSVKTGSAMPRGTNTFEAAPYYNGLKTEKFPYATDLDHHHGDWVKVDLNAAGYWEVEDGKVRVWYIPADASDTPVTLHEAGVLDFDHDGRDAEAITDSGYFVVSSNKSATFSDVPTTKMDLDKGYGKTIKDLLGGDSVAIEVYALNSSKSDNQTWTVNGEKFTVNPAYGMAIEHGDHTTTMGASADEAYQIRTVGQLENMGGAENTMYFQQTHDIVFDSSTAYTSPTNFGGHFDGGFYRIIDNTKPVFDTVVGSSATDPIIKNVIVYAPQGNTNISGNGGLAASTSGDVEIRNTIVAGFTISSSSGNVGGLVGEVTGGSLTIKNSEATNTLTGTGSNSNVGGLVGNVASGAALTIERSYAGGYIKKEGSTKVNAAGGLVGFASTPENVSYENVYSYVNMMDASAGTYYGIGPGKVTNDSDLSDYWATGLDKKTVSDTDANIKGVTLADMKLHTQAMDKTDSSVTVEEYLKPDTNRDEGLKNLAEGKAEAEKFDLFPFAAFVTGKDTNYHYGDYPVAEYVGLYYYEKEVIFDAKNPMETNATTGKITNEDKARTEYNYYAYGGELFDADGDGTSEIYGQRVLDTLCYDHHLTGEYAYIAESGYGYFYPGADGAYKATVKDFQNKNEIKDHTDTLLSTGDQVREHLLEAFDVTSGADFQVYKMVTAGGYIAETWTLSPTDTTISGEVVMKVNTAFGGAISNDMKAAGGLGGDRKDGKLGDGIQIRTMQQLQNLTDNRKVDDDSAINDYEHFEITHDINGRGFENASNSGRGYIPGVPGAKVIEGNGYRIFDLNISVDKDHPSSDTNSDRQKDAALFTSLKSGSRDTDDEAPASVSGIILYSTTGDAKITSEEGAAAGIVAYPGAVPVTDCVVAGYTITGATYVGGIAGEMNNSGSKISDCQAVSVTLAGGKSGVGGIAGKGRGTITDCYAGGVIKNVNTNVPVGGIYGDGHNNSQPTVKESYSYMDLRDSTNKGTKYAIGETSSGIEATSCYYLTEYATGANTTAQGDGLDFDAMCNKRTDDTTADYVYVPNGTDTIDGITSWGDGAYPMAAVVKVGVHAGVDTGVDKTGEVLVHYGEWPYCARAAGIAYWEKVDGGYKIQIVGADFYGNALYKDVATSELYGDKLCEERHVDGGTITEHNITDSGYAVFTTNSALAVTATGLPNTEASSDKSGVVAAINKALGGACLSSETKVYSNNDVDTGSVKTATVKHDGTEVKDVTLNYNPGMSGVSYDPFGTTTNPVSIRTVRQLDDIPSTCNKHFKQTHDLYGNPTGGSAYSGYTGAVEFAGTYDGQGYKILELSITDKAVTPSAGTTTYLGAGLFSSTGGDVKLENIIMYSPSGKATIESKLTNTEGSGGLVAKTNSGTCTINNCIVAGYQIKGTQYVGGLVGYAYYSVEITNSASVNYIENTGSGGAAGGIIGAGHSGNKVEASVTNCYSGGTLKTGDVSVVVGGIFGKDMNNGTGMLTVTNCYTYVKLSDVKDGSNEVYIIGNPKDINSNSKNNYYLDDSSRYPAGCELQGTAKSYDELGKDSDWRTMFPDTAQGKATNSYVPNGKSAGGATSNDGMTAYTSTSSFPFPEMVQVNGAYVHYGEWPATNAAPTSSWKVGVFMGLRPTTGTDFDSDSDAVAYMFDGNGMRYRLGMSSRSTTCSYLGLVIDGTAPTGLQVIYFADGVTNDGGNLTGKVTSCYNFDASTTEKSVTPGNAAQFGNYTLYKLDDNITLKMTNGAVVIANGANVSGTTGTTATIDAKNVVGWFKLKELNDTKGKALYTDPKIPKGASLSGVMSAAVPEGFMPEVLALPENELAGEPVEGETEEILPPDTPDAIKPEEFTLPDPENTDDNGDDGHTEIIDIRVSVARVRRVR